VFVIEVNDNPNIDSGMEDAILGDALYGRVLEQLLREYEAPHATAGALPPRTAGSEASPPSRIARL
jgi:hypothetical protein